MEMNRRAMLATSALAVTLPAAIAGARAASASPRRARASVAHRQFVRMAQAQGARQLPAESIVRGFDANSGLNYSVNFAHPELGPNMYVVQPAARVDDIDQRQKAAVLPYFTIAGLTHDVDEAARPTAALISGLHYLLGLGVPLHSMEFTTSEASPEMIRVARALGVDPKRVIVRDKDEAVTAGDGSGWFVDPITGFTSRTMSIAAIRDGKKAELLEAGDIGFVVGLERAEWARTGKIEDWDSAAHRLLADVRRESTKSGGPLPAGYASFAATTS